MKVRKYKLKKVKKDNEYTRYLVLGLHEIYHRYDDGRLSAISGAVALLKNPDYPGYCMLMYCYCEVEGGEYNITFTPVYNEKGARVLIKHQHESVFCVFSPYCHEIVRDENGNYIRKKDGDGELCFLNNGVHKEM